MDFIRISYGFPMDSLWMSYGFRSPLDFLRISFIWISYGFPHGFPMGFLWLSYGFQMDYEEGGPSEGGGPSVLGIEGGQRSSSSSFSITKIWCLNNRI